MSLTTRVLLALAAGVAVGLVLNQVDPNISRVAADVVEPVGTLFVNAIRMTVIPLVVSSLIVGIATSGSGAAVAKIGGRGIVVFVSLLVASGVVGALVAPPILGRINVDAAAVASLRAGSVDEYEWRVGRDAIADAVVRVTRAVESLQGRR